MRRKSLQLIAWLILLCLIPIVSQAAEPSQPLDLARLMPTLMVKVTRLSGVAPDGSRLPLMEAPDGVVVPIEDFSPLSSRLIAVKRKPPVAFHTLRAELAPGIFAQDRAGRLVQLASTVELPATIPLLGAVLQLDDGIKMLGVRAELATPMATRTEVYRPRYREFEHDD